MKHKHAELEADQKRLEWLAGNSGGFESLVGGGVEVYWHDGESALAIQLDNWRDAIDKAMAAMTELKNKKDRRKPVDLSVLIDSGIDCAPMADFGSEGYVTVGSNKPRQHLFDMRFKPRMNYWFSTRNKFNNGVLNYPNSELERAGFAVEWANSYYAFRITGLRDGYDWPWNIGEQDG